MKRGSDLRVRKIKPLISPALLLEELPLKSKENTQIQAQRQSISAIIQGHDPRLLVIVGPCSIHDPQAALEYAAKLSAIAERLQDKILILMRVYFEKPRTTVGWKGLINDPHLDDTYDINHGLRIARELMLKITHMNLPIAAEFLDTITPQYIADLVSWGAIGARTTESQIHRELASGLSMPIGFKNATSGDIGIALDAIVAANHPHSFLGVTQQGLSAIVMTEGNEDAHLVLRGGKTGPNYDQASLEKINALLQARNIKTGLIVDASHANSEKNHLKQIDVIQALCTTYVTRKDIPLRGVMIESHLQGGRQDLQKGASLVYGQSITDACLSWDDTLTLLEQLAVMP